VCVHIELSNQLSIQRQDPAARRTAATTSIFVAKGDGVVLMGGAEAEVAAPKQTKTVAVYGGSFDPITNGHLNIAAEIIHMKKADEGEPVHSWSLAPVTASWLIDVFLQSGSPLAVRGPTNPLLRRLLSSAG
jgi:hypothetical protein